MPARALPRRGTAGLVYQPRRPEAASRHPGRTRDRDEDSVRGHPLFGDVPRMVVEWDGRTWQPVAVADNYAAAYEMITQPGRPPLFPQPHTPVPLLRAGTGRHRRK
ncbi:DUF6087 family protein [Kitasatospora sp. NPDC085879]|uniref:DUF6087 family protein n=1 Tax=Kitasatospora sp. NPDC085879 TaxID=3154769 RepID=UPI003431A966